MSSSCSSVYVDGSEARGSVNGSVLVKYGTYTGLARFTVWMPEFPLDLQVPDTRLSQVKSWKVPDFHARLVKVLLSKYIICFIHIQIIVYTGRSESSFQ